MYDAARWASESADAGDESCRCGSDGPGDPCGEATTEPLSEGGATAEPCREPGAQLSLLLRAEMFAAVEARRPPQKPVAATTLPRARPHAPLSTERLFSLSPADLAGSRASRGSTAAPAAGRPPPPWVEW